MSVGQYAWDNPNWHKRSYEVDNDIWLPRVTGELPLSRTTVCMHTRLTLKGPCPRCNARFDADGKQLP